MNTLRGAMVLGVLAVLAPMNGEACTLLVPPPGETLAQRTAREAPYDIARARAVLARSNVVFVGRITTPLYEHEIGRTTWVRSVKALRGSPPRTVQIRQEPNTNHADCTGSLRPEYAFGGLSRRVGGDVLVLARQRQARLVGRTFRLGPLEIVEVSNGGGTYGRTLVRAFPGTRLR